MAFSVRIICVVTGPLFFVYESFAIQLMLVDIPLQPSHESVIKSLKRNRATVEAMGSEVDGEGNGDHLFW